jgi:hypothetical protein
MSKVSKSNYIRMFSDAFFHKSERDRLKLMKEHGSEREVQSHGDFLSQAHCENVTDRVQRCEHHGATFWNHYYAGERPYPVLRGDPLPKHEFGTIDDQDSQWNTILDPENIVHDVPTMGHERLDFTDQIASERHWMSSMRLADWATWQGDFSEALRHLHEAKSEAEQWGVGNEKLLQTEDLIVQATAALQNRAR